MWKIFKKSFEDSDLPAPLVGLIWSAAALIAFCVIGLTWSTALDSYCRVTGKCKADEIRAKAAITISSAPAEGSR